MLTEIKSGHLYKLNKSGYSEKVIRKRFVTSFTNLLTKMEKLEVRETELRKNIAIKRAKMIHGRWYKKSGYPNYIVFYARSISELKSNIETIKTIKPYDL